jgi:benzil reductase ((S)-benzoin forming)
MNKIILITGANRGLGKALVDVALKDEHTFIVSLSRSLHQEHEGISDAKLLFIETDLSEPFSNSFLEPIEDRILTNTALYFFNNASIIMPIAKIGTFEDLDIANSIQVNVQYPVSLINSLLHRFPMHQTVLVNISSGAANNPIPYWSLYGAAKAYMNQFYKVLAVENVENNFTFYTIDPGVLDTGMQESIRENAFPKQDYFKALKEDNKLIQPKDAALKIFDTINYYE